MLHSAQFEPSSLNAKHNKGTPCMHEALSMNNDTPGQHRKAIIIITKIGT